MAIDAPAMMSPREVRDALKMNTPRVPRPTNPATEQVVGVAPDASVEQADDACAAAKGALVAMTHALAVSLGPKVRANCILPGWIDTGPWQKAANRSDADHSDADRNQHPVGRVGRVEDIAGLVAWLASDEAGFVTGQRFVVDGGMTVRMIYAD